MSHLEDQHDVVSFGDGVYAETYPKEQGYGFRIGDAIELIYESRMNFGRRELAERAARKMYAYFITRGRIPKGRS